MANKQTLTVLADKSLPLVSKIFNGKDFELSSFDGHQALPHSADIIICRAHTKVNQQFLGRHRPQLIATASSGSDHLDKAFLKQQNIRWLDAIGCNAQSVCDYILHLLYHPKLNEQGTKVGIIGVGHVGTQLNKTLSLRNYQTVLYDPPRQLNDANFQSAPFEALFDCNIISLHVPLKIKGINKTKNLIDEAFLSKLNAGTVIINTSRGEVIKENIIPQYRQLHFCLDVFQNEPSINKTTVEHCLFATPHIAGHAIEAKQRAITMLYNKICQQFKLKPTANAFDELNQNNDILLKQHLSFNYDPMSDTQSLKQDCSIENFLKLRKAHNKRHELKYTQCCF